MYPLRKVGGISDPQGRFYHRSDTGWRVPKRVALYDHGVRMMEQPIHRRRGHQVIHEERVPLIERSVRSDHHGAQHGGGLLFLYAESRGRVIRSVAQVSNFDQACQHARGVLGEAVVGHVGVVQNFDGQVAIGFAPSNPESPSDLIPEGLFQGLPITLP
jgi:hypothetical protein